MLNVLCGLIIGSRKTDFISKEENPPRASVGEVTSPDIKRIVKDNRINKRIEFIIFFVFGNATPGHFASLMAPLSVYITTLRFVRFSTRRAILKAPFGTYLNYRAKFARSQLFGGNCLANVVP